MNTDSKPVEAITIADLKIHPVWEYVNDDELGETHVSPVKQFPIGDLAGRLVGTQVQLANGNSVWATIENFDGRNPRMNEHFLTLSIERTGKWFTLARYHDLDYAERGPEALANFLGLAVDQVFPISYDLRGYAEGDNSILVGQVTKVPREKLSRSQIIALAVS